MSRIQFVTAHWPRPARCSGMPSTVIRRFNYRPDAQELEVEFTTGRRYVYCDVPPDEVEALRGAFAKGIHFNRRIRGRYAYREIEPGEPYSST